MIGHLYFFLQKFHTDCWNIKIENMGLYLQKQSKIKGILASIKIGIVWLYTKSEDDQGPFHEWLFSIIIPIQWKFHSALI